ncbi:MAG: NUDIX domain-containing protein [Bacteroidetes bacterium]|nr:NUDIX domain-containing protein [Bacteroidota bacterium]
MAGPQDFIAVLKTLKNEPDKENITSYTYLPLISLLPGEFRLVMAAGGLVYHPSCQVLFIYRHGKWDLPKGKLKKTESLEDCGIREVSEETGLTGLTIRGLIGTSYHIYLHKNKQFLKETFWYDMLYEGTEQPVPQVEEDITEVKWFNLEESLKIINLSYRSLQDLAVTHIKRLISQR